MWILPYVWRLVLLLAVLTLVYLSDSYYLPRFRWYCRLRTVIYRWLPYEGAVLGVNLGNYVKPCRVLTVNRKGREILVEERWKDLDGTDIVQNEWFRLKSSDLTWLPDWTEV